MNMVQVINGILPDWTEKCLKYVYVFLSQLKALSIRIFAFLAGKPKRTFLAYKFKLMHFHADENQRCVFYVFPPLFNITRIIFFINFKDLS